MAETPSDPMTEDAMDAQPHRLILRPPGLGRLQANGRFDLPLSQSRLLRLVLSRSMLLSRSPLSRRASRISARMILAKAFGSKIGDRRADDLWLDPRWRRR